MIKAFAFLVRQGPALALLLLTEDLLTFLAAGPSTTLAARVLRCAGSAQKSEAARRRILALPGARRAIESIAELATTISAESANG